MTGAQSENRPQAGRCRIAEQIYMPFTTTYIHLHR